MSTLKPFRVEKIRVNRIGDDATSLCIKSLAIRHDGEDKPVLVNVCVGAKTYINRALSTLYISTKGLVLA